MSFQTDHGLLTGWRRNNGDRLDHVANGLSQSLGTRLQVFAN
ncbi:MAG: hypothetical protein ACOY91_15220 [Pseudomonadota bacterium]